MMMKMMINEFLEKNLCIELKNIGFDEPCIAYYRDTGNLRSVDQQWGTSIKGISESLGYYCQDLNLAPTYQQVFAWFREKYNLYHEISPKKSWPDNVVTGFEFYAQITDKNGVTTNYDDVMDYKEAEIFCITKMLDMVKNF